MRAEAFELNSTVREMWHLGLADSRWLGQTCRQHGSGFLHGGTVGSTEVAAKNSGA